MWFFQASASDCSNPRLCFLLLFIIPIPSRFPNPCHSHHTGSSAHLGVPCLRPSICDCRTWSFAHLCATRIRPSIPIAHSNFLYLPVAFLLHAHIITAPTPPYSFPRVCQGGPKFNFRCLLAPTRLPPPPPDFVPYLPCTHLK